MKRWGRTQPRLTQPRLPTRQQDSAWVFLLDAHKGLKQTPGSRVVVGLQERVQDDQHLACCEHTRNKLGVHRNHGHLPKNLGQ